MAGLVCGCGAPAESGADPGLEGDEHWTDIDPFAPARPQQGGNESAPEADEPALELPAAGGSAENALNVYAGTAVLPEGEFWQRLASARAVCVGELHYNADHHALQSRMLNELAVRAEAEGRQLAVGFEMFQRPYQAALDAFVAGEIDTPQLLERTEYYARWGLPFEFYQPLLETARTYGFPALALNAPAELTRKIARTGLESLTLAERGQLPELDLQNPAHACYFANLGQPGPCSEQTEPSNTYTAQVVWDETMAETSAAWLSQAGEGAQLVVFAGMAHCQQSAIPQRITRRTGIEVVNVMPLEPTELQQFGAAAEVFELILRLPVGN